MFSADVSVDVVLALVTKLAVGTGEFQSTNVVEISSYMRLVDSRDDAPGICENKNRNLWVIQML